MTGMCDAQVSPVPGLVLVEKPIKSYVRCCIANSQFSHFKNLKGAV